MSLGDGSRVCRKGRHEPRGFQSVSRSKRATGRPASPASGAVVGSKQGWTRAHALVDELETTDGMAVHAYLHRKGGQASNADYWYERAGRRFQRSTLDEEWQALVEGLLSGTDEG
jgi:hypothetical protein